MTKLEEKARTDSLTVDDHKALVALSENLFELKRRQQEAPEIDEIRDMSDADLLKAGEEAVRGLKKLVTVGGKGGK